MRHITSTRSIGVGQLDMHVHAAQHVALADHLQVVHHGVVAFLRRLLRHRPTARSDACRRQGSRGHAWRRSRRRSGADARSSVRASAMLVMRRGDRPRSATAGIRRATRPPVASRAASKNACGMPSRDALGLRVDQEIFFLDAEGEIASHSLPRLVVSRVSRTVTHDATVSCFLGGAGVMPQVSTPPAVSGSHGKTPENSIKLIAASMRHQHRHRHRLAGCCGSRRRG